MGLKGLTEEGFVQELSKGSRGGLREGIKEGVVERFRGFKGFESRGSKGPMV